MVSMWPLRISYLIAHIKPPPAFGRAIGNPWKLVMSCVQRDLTRRVALFWTKLHACLLLIHNLNCNLPLLLLPLLPHLPHSLLNHS